MNTSPIEISATQAAQWIRGGAFLLDVREPFEADLASISGAHLIPLSQLPSRLSELPKDRRIVAHCHFGRRSLHATALLRSNGYDATSLAGGINAWSKDVDPTVPVYGH